MVPILQCLSYKICSNMLQKLSHCPKFFPTGISILFRGIPTIIHQRARCYASMTFEIGQYTVVISCNLMLDKLEAQVHKTHFAIFMLSGS